MSRYMAHDHPLHGVRKRHIKKALIFFLVAPNIGAAGIYSLRNDDNEEVVLTYQAIIDYVASSKRFEKERGSA